MSRKYRYVIRYSAVYDNFRNQRDGLNLKVGNVRLGLPELPPESGMITIYRSLVSVPLPFPLTVFFFFFFLFSSYSYIPFCFCLSTHVHVFHMYMSENVSHSVVSNAL